ncbi:hypothetical protein BgiBS90_004983 [Biomphalaria glabrata]|nr:hypothetical protein BgiBS90_004983 [Biomphalaria glabrata]
MFLDCFIIYCRQSCEIGGHTFHRHCHNLNQPDDHMLVNIWIQPDPSSNRLRRDYDHSRNGPVRDQTWYALERELNYRERCFSFIKKPTTFE